MKLFDFLDIKYRSTAIDLQKDYSPFIDGRAKAAHELIGFCRALSKWFHFPMLLGEYLLVLSHCKRPPELPEPPSQPPNPGNLSVVPKAS